MTSRNQRIAELLLARRREIGASVAEKHLAKNPWFIERFGESGRKRCIEDAEFHLQYLGHAVALSAPALFIAYTRWTRQLLEKRHIPWCDLQENLSILRDELTAILHPSDAALTAEYIDAAIAAEPSDIESFLTGTPREPIARAYLTALLAMERGRATDLILDAAENGVAISDLYLHVFQPVQREIGRLWQYNEITVAEEHYCTASTQALMAQLYPRILSSPRVGRKIVVASVGNELHEIGTRMVADFFEMAGWDGVYIGANTPSAALVELVCRERPQVVALGVTMTYHLGIAAELIGRLRADDRCAEVKIIAGGYVFAQQEDLWRRLGVDGFGADAAEAVSIGNKLVDGS